MSTRARLLGGALSLLALLALSAAGLASAAAPPPPTRQVGPAQPGKLTKVGQTAPGAAATPHAVIPVGYRLTADLTPSSSTSTATGRWIGILVHTVGIVRNGAMPSVAGCTVTAPKAGGPGQAPPRKSGQPHRIKCSTGAGAVPAFAVPGSGNHWILGWVLTYDHLSSSVSGADIHVTAAAGAAAVSPMNLCTTCTSGKFGRTMLTSDQANAIVNGQASVVVKTANNPGGEISGQIVQVKPISTAKASTGKNNKK
jgi:hypothetical protein